MENTFWVMTPSKEKEMLMQLVTGDKLGNEFKWFNKPTSYMLV